MAKKKAQNHNPGWYWVRLTCEDGEFVCRYDGDSGWWYGPQSVRADHIAEVLCAVQGPFWCEVNQLAILCAKNPETEQGHSQHIVCVENEMFRDPEEILEACQDADGRPVAIYKLIEQGLIKMPEALPELVPVT